MDYEAFALGAKILSGFFIEPPSLKRFELLKQQGLLQGWFITSPHFANTQGKELWEQSLRYDDSSEIAADFTRLFIADEEYLKAPPYASYYLESSGETFTQESDELSKLYASLNFTPTLYPHEPCDHLASELEFLALLLKQNIANPSPSALLLSFLEYRLTPWSNECLAYLQKNALTPFYQGVGYLTQDLLETLKESLGIKAQKRTIYRSIRVESQE